MKWRVELAPRARRQFEAIAPEVRLRILMDIKVLEAGPLHPSSNIKKLRGFKTPTYRLRSGDFRAVFRIEKEIVIVAAVFDRKNLDKELRSLRN